MIINNKLYYNYLIITLIYIALAGILFPKQSIIALIVSGGFAVISLYWFFKSISYLKIFSIIKVYSIYLLVLVFFSSSPLDSLKIYLKVFTAIWLLPVSVYVFKDINNIRRLNNKMIILMILFICNFIIMNILGIGFKGYGNTIQTGNLFTEGLNSMVYITAYTPVLYFTNPNKSKNKYIFFLQILTIVIVIIVMKRISIIAIIISLVLYLIFSSNKSSYVKYIGIGLILIMASFPFWEETLLKQIENRGTQMNVEKIEDEARYWETYYVFNGVFSFDNISHSVFGNELFNSQGKYGPMKLFGVERQIHNDYARLLYDSGIIGLVLYLFLQYSILKKFIIYKRKVVHLMEPKLFNILNSAFLSVFFIFFFINVSGGVDGTLFQALRYMILGGIIGVYYNKLSPQNRATLQILTNTNKE